MIYVDTSALARVLLEEPASSLLRARLEGKDLVSSSLLAVELRHAFSKGGVPVETTTHLLNTVALIPIDQSVLTTAALLADLGCKSLDAIHLASASLVCAESVITYDERMAKFAARLGLEVERPGID